MSFCHLFSHWTKTILSPWSPCCPLLESASSQSSLHSTIQWHSFILVLHLLHRAAWFSFPFLHLMKFRRSQIWWLTSTAFGMFATTASRVVVLQPLQQRKGRQFKMIRPMQENACFAIGLILCPDLTAGSLSKLSGWSKEGLRNVEQACIPWPVLHRDLWLLWWVVNYPIYVKFLGAEKMICYGVSSPYSKTISKWERHDQACSWYCGVSFALWCISA